MDGAGKSAGTLARHLLSHTSGFQNWRSEKEPLKLHFTPGERFLYSGEGYFYLQSVLTRLIGSVDRNDCSRFEGGLEVCATDFEARMEANLLAPFGMQSSGYVWNETFAKRMARPHDLDGRPTESKKSTRPVVARYGAAGALLTTPTDYAKFVIEVMDPRPADAFRLTRSSIREMLRPHVKLEGEGGRHESSWALGWQIIHDKRRGSDLIYHGGDNAGFHCCALASVEHKTGFVAMTNGDNGPEVLKSLLTDDLMQRFLAGDLEDESGARQSSQLR